MISANQDSILKVIDSNISNINFLKNVLLYSSIGIILLLYFFMITYCVKSNYKAKEKLTDLMYISDSEARMLQDNAEKMKYAVEMARKNFDVDTQNLLLSGN
jgi:ATP-dependent Zn protease